MSTQNLNEATKLYEMLGKFVPAIPPEDYTDYINEILENIKKSGNYNVYFDAITLMTGATYNTLTQNDSVHVLELFIKSLMEWHIVELIAFFRNVGYTND